MDFTFQQYEESAQAIRARLGGFARRHPGDQLFAAAGEVQMFFASHRFNQLDDRVYRMWRAFARKRRAAM